MGKFDNIKYEPMEYKIKWFLPLSFTRKYEMFASFMQFYRDIQKGKKRDVNLRRTQRGIQGTKQK
ncbi:hypothetical protein KAW65_06740 [candidate division WOR-3 bacterium]|nr:hypothetical protein [candidate division WOR-3 bacterium]